MALPRRTIGSRMEKQIHVQGMFLAALIIFVGIFPTCAFVLHNNGEETATEENKIGVNDKTFDQGLKISDFLENWTSRSDLDWDTGGTGRNEELEKGDFLVEGFKAEKGKDNGDIKIRSVRSEPTAKIKSEKLSRKNAQRESVSPRKLSGKTIDSSQKTKSQEENRNKKSQIKAPGGYLTLEERISAWLLAKRKEDNDWEDESAENDFSDTRSKPVSEDDDVGMLVHIDKMKKYDVNDNPYGDQDLDTRRGYSDPSEFVGQYHGYHYPSGYNSEEEQRRHAISDDGDQYRDFLDVQKSKRGKNYEKMFGKDRNEFNNVGASRDSKTNKPMFFYYYDPDSHYAPSGMKPQLQFYDKDYGVDDSMLFDENEVVEGKGKRNMNPKGGKFSRERNADVNSFYTLENYVEQTPAVNKISSTENINASPLISYKDSSLKDGVRSVKQNKKKDESVESDVSMERLGENKNKNGRHSGAHVQNVNQDNFQEVSQESKVNVRSDSDLENAEIGGETVNGETEITYRDGKPVEMSANSQELVHKNQETLLQVENVNIDNLIESGENSSNKSGLPGSKSTNETRESKIEKRSSPENEIAMNKSESIDQNKIRAQAKDVNTTVTTSQISSVEMTENQKNDTLVSISIRKQKEDTLNTLEKSIRELGATFKNDTDIPSNGAILILATIDSTTSEQDVDTIPILRNVASKIMAVAQDASPPKSLSNVLVATLPSIEHVQEMFHETVKSDSEIVNVLFNKTENNGSVPQTAFNFTDTTQTKKVEINDVGSDLSLSNVSLSNTGAEWKYQDNQKAGTVSVLAINSSMTSEHLTTANMSFLNKNLTKVEFLLNFENVRTTSPHDVTEQNLTSQDVVAMGAVGSVTNATRNIILHSAEQNFTHETLENNNTLDNNDIDERTNGNDVIPPENEKIPTVYSASFTLSREGKLALNRSDNVSLVSFTNNESENSTLDGNVNVTSRKADIQSNKVLIRIDVVNNKSNESLQISDSHAWNNSSDKNSDITSSQELFPNETRHKSERSDKEHIEISLAEIAPQGNGKDNLEALVNSSKSKLPPDQVLHPRALNGSIESFSEKALFQNTNIPITTPHSGNGSNISDHPLDSDDVQRSMEDLSLKVMGVHQVPEVVNISTAHPNVTLQYAGNNTWVFATTETVTAGSRHTQSSQSSSVHERNSSLAVNSAASQSQPHNNSTEVNEEQNKHVSIGSVLEAINSSYGLNLEHSNTNILENSDGGSRHLPDNVTKSHNNFSNSENTSKENYIPNNVERNTTSEEYNLSPILNPQHKTLTATFLSDSNFSRKLMSIPDNEFSNKTDLNETRNSTSEGDFSNTTRRFIVSSVSDIQTTSLETHGSIVSTAFKNITADHLVTKSSKSNQEVTTFNNTLKSFNETSFHPDTFFPASNSSGSANKTTSSFVTQLMKNEVIPNAKKLQTHAPQVQNIAEVTNSTFSNMVTVSKNSNIKLENNTAIENDFRKNKKGENSTVPHDDSISVENFLKSHSVSIRNTTTDTSTVHGLSNNIVTNSSTKDTTVNLTNSDEVQKSTVTRREIIASSSVYGERSASNGSYSSSVTNVTSWFSGLSEKNESEREINTNSSRLSHTNKTNFETTMNPGVKTLKTGNGSFQTKPVADSSKEAHVREAESFVPVVNQTFHSSSFHEISAPTNGSSTHVVVSSSESDIKIDAERGSDAKADDLSHSGTSSPTESDIIVVPPISAYMVQDFSLRKPNQDTKTSTGDNKITQAGGEHVKSGSSINVDNSISSGSENNTNGKLSNNTDLPCVGPACDLGPLSVPPRSQAAVSAVLTSHFGPTKDTMIPFDLELLDLADNYDNTTGMFICTIPGTYVISLYLMSHPGAKVNARVYINNRPIAALWADDSKNAGFYPSSSTQTIAQLGFGDQVYVMLVDGGYGDSWVHANYNVFTIFLLYEQLF